MAVFEGQTRSITPAFQNIQEALNQQANLELKRPQTTDIFTPIVQRLDTEFTKQRDFEKKLAADGKTLFTPDMAKQLSKETGIPEEAYTKAVGRYYNIDEMQKIHEIAIQNNAEKTLTKTGGASAGLTPEEVQTMQLTGKAGKDAIAERTFQKDKTGKQVPFADSTSSTGYRWGILGPNGISPTTYEAPKPGAGTGTGGKEKSLPTAERNRLETLQTLRNQLQNINDSFDETAVGPIAGRMAAGKTKVEGLSNARQSTFIKATTSLRNEIIRARSGGAVTPSEADRLIQELPDTNSSETDFRAKFDNTRTAFNEIMDTRVQSLKEVGYKGIDAYEKSLQPVDYTMDLPRADRDKRYNEKFNKGVSTATKPKEVTDEEASNYLKTHGKIVNTDNISKVKAFLGKK